MSEDSKLVTRLTEALVHEWSNLYETEEIACNQALVDLMISVIPAIETPTEFIRNFYMKVFLRDVWTSEERE